MILHSKFGTLYLQIWYFELNFSENFNSELSENSMEITEIVFHMNYNHRRLNLNYLIVIKSSNLIVRDEYVGKIHKNHYGIAFSG